MFPWSHPGHYNAPMTLLSLFNIMDLYWNTEIKIGNRTMRIIPARIPANLLMTTSPAAASLRGLSSAIRNWVRLSISKVKIFPRSLSSASSAVPARWSRNSLLPSAISLTASVYSMIPSRKSSRSARGVFCFLQGIPVILYPCCRSCSQPIQFFLINYPTWSDPQ